MDYLSALQAYILQQWAKSKLTDSQRIMRAYTAYQASSKGKFYYPDSTIGKVGDFLREPHLRKFSDAARNVPIILSNRKIVHGAIEPLGSYTFDMANPDNVGPLKLYPNSPQPPGSQGETLLHEIAHFLQGYTEPAKVGSYLQRTYGMPVADSLDNAANQTIAPILKYYR